MIKAKKGSCSECSKESYITAGKCGYCYWKHRSKLKKLEKEKRGIITPTNKIYNIPKFSKKRKIENALYVKKRRIFMEHNKTCQAQLSGCTHLATDLHHPRGRLGKLLTDETNFLALCRSCHTFIETNPEFAKEEGYSLSRLEIF